MKRCIECEELIPDLLINCLVCDCVIFQDVLEENLEELLQEAECAKIKQTVKYREEDALYSEG